jgi:trigger factor
MQTTVEETDKHTVKLTIEVPPDELAKDLDKAYRKIAQSVKIPGFRKGKVPRQIIDAQVGREVVLGEFLEDSVPDYYREALRENDLAPIANPDINVETTGADGEALIFTATVEVRPRLTFAPEDYRGLEIDKPSAEVSDDDVAKLLDSLRDRFAELETVNRPVRSGDYVTMDIRATLHDEEIPEGTRPDYLYEVDSGEFGDKVDTELEGKRAGEILQVNDVLGPGAGEQAGEEVTFRILLKEVKGKKLPDADDEFAKTASEFDTLDELKDSLREQLGKNKERQADGAVRDLALEKLVDSVDVDLPETLIDEETEQRVAHARERAEQLGMTLDRYLEAQGFDELRFRADARDHAIRAVKADLVLEAVARAEDIQVPPEELGGEIARLAQALGRDPKEVAKNLDRSGQVVALAGDIIRSKSLDVIVEHAKIRSDGPALQSETTSTEPPNEDTEVDPSSDLEPEGESS